MPWHKLLQCRVMGTFWWADITSMASRMTLLWCAIKEPRTRPAWRVLLALLGRKGPPVRLEQQGRRVQSVRLEPREHKDLLARLGQPAPLDRKVPPAPPG